MPADAIYVDETILHSPMVRQHLTWTRRRATSTSMAASARTRVALGVKLASPQRPVAY